MKIIEAERTDLSAFFTYLERQLAENGVGEGPLFQPLSRTQNTVGEQTRDKFSKGFDAEPGQPTWRKLWLVMDEQGRVKGHIDLRHHGGEHSFHRVLMGMGVDSSCRKLGLGQRLVNTVLAYCQAKPGIEWLDLNVLASNLPAQSLYLKCGFNIIGRTEDYYRIDGESVAEISMTISTGS
ncbi:GNAT family N-acetyltransferase [Shewanella sedimentimangrovi]|uniref:GNAT family N-acetyltransferase n=1 Tax=Shewanella sedimentimangrovi TaxID=2814293 RepID=A0ABX7R4J5_9GAMM|nr:N-acetyltransferase [Shewanella sedimentimangrovi]QSX38404.1 GNAT family N-acetyltransferase [Shewanella sedimentimangrovi]